MTVEEVESKTGKSKEELKKLLKNDLTKMCKDKGYKTSGNIPDLINRILHLDGYRIEEKIDFLYLFKLLI